MEFKGKQGQLTMVEYESDSLISIENELGQSVATISTRNAFWEESKMYGQLFSKAPEMLEMLNECYKYFCNNTFSRYDILTPLKMGFSFTSSFVALNYFLA